MDRRIETVLCGANSYNKKYYLNPRFAALPENVRKELNILCVIFTEQQGGIFSMGFDADGRLLLSVDHEPDDPRFDEESCDEAIRDFSEENAELMQQLTLYYNLLVLGKSPEELTFTS